MLHNRIAKKKVETDKYHEIAETDRIRTEIDRDIAMGAIRESLSEDDYERVNEARKRRYYYY